jgi:hypothetical protein
MRGQKDTWHWHRPACITTSVNCAVHNIGCVIWKYCSSCVYQYTEYRLSTVAPTSGIVKVWMQETGNRMDWTFFHLRNILYPSCVRTMYVHNYQKGGRSHYRLIIISGFHTVLLRWWLMDVCGCVVSGHTTLCNMKNS